jgi:hypothetical protein
MSKIYVLCRDCGYEGLGEPFIGFRTREQAEGAKDMVERITFTASLKVVEVAFYDEGEALTASEKRDSEANG